MGATRGGTVAPMAYPQDAPRRARFERQYAALLAARAAMAAQDGEVAEAEEDTAAARAFARVAARVRTAELTCSDAHAPLRALRAAVCASAGVADSAEALSRAHECWAAFDRESACASDKAAMLAALADADDDIARQFRAAYEALVTREALPALAAWLREGGADVDVESCGARFYFQAVPCVRVQQPCRWHTLRPHFDRMYGHDARTLNFYVPLSARTFDSCALQLESAAGAEDFAPLALRFGQMAAFHAAELAHMTVANETDCTRVTLDFRVVWARLHEPPPVASGAAGGAARPVGRYEVGGYYSVAELGAAGHFQVVERGEPSEQHGFPFGARGGAPSKG